MILSFILLCVIYLCVVQKEITNDSKYTVTSLICSIVLFFGLIFTVANREECGKATALKYLGYTTYSQKELYYMSDYEKSQVIKTYKNLGIQYWKENVEETAK